MKYSLLFIIVYICLIGTFWSQDSIQKQIHFGGMNTDRSQHEIKLVASDSSIVTISKLKCYLSSFEFYMNDQLVFKEKNSYHLVDLFDSKTIDLSLPKNVKYNIIKFAVGIDSLTSVMGAFGGDLDPTNGMYWTWQSGYINVMIEGKCSQCNTRINEFTLHLGGYQYPNNAYQEISLPVSSNKSSINIAFDLTKWISLIDLSSTPSVMSPSRNAVQLSFLFSQCFHIVK